MLVKVGTHADRCLRKIQILPLPSQYILTLLLFVVQNRNQFKANLEIHDVNTRQHFDFHQPLSCLSKYQKGVYYNGIKVFYSLPSYIKDKSDDYRDFKLIFKTFFAQKLILLITRILSVEQK